MERQQQGVRDGLLPRTPTRASTGDTGGTAASEQQAAFSPPADAVFGTTHHRRSSSADADVDHTAGAGVGASPTDTVLASGAAADRDGAGAGVSRPPRMRKRRPTALSREYQRQYVTFTAWARMKLAVGGIELTDLLEDIRFRAAGVGREGRDGEGGTAAGRPRQWSPPP